jgi:hypothetical protein
MMSWRRVVVVVDRMQTGYSYPLTEPIERNFDPEFRSSRKVWASSGPRKTKVRSRDPNCGGSRHLPVGLSLNQEARRRRPLTRSSPPACSWSAYQSRGSPAESGDTRQLVNRNELTPL